MLNSVRAGKQIRARYPHETGGATLQNHGDINCKYLLNCLEPHYLVI